MACSNRRCAHEAHRCGLGPDAPARRKQGPGPPRQRLTRSRSSTPPSPLERTSLTTSPKPRDPLATIEPATSRWIAEGTKRHAITLLVFMGLMAGANVAGARVDPRAYLVMLVWLGLNFVVGPWAARPIEYQVRLRRYAVTVVLDVVLLGVLYVFLDAVQWLGALFFVHSALVASATLPRRWAFGIAALIVLVYSGLVWFAIAGPIVVASPVGLSDVRGNYTYGMGQVVAAMGLITILMLLQERLVESMRAAEQRYLLLVRAAPDMVMTFDAAGHFVDVNPATEAQTGYSWDELKQLPNTSFFPAEDWPNVVAARLRNVAGETVSLEARYIRKNGEVRWIQTTSAPVLHAGDQGVILVIARDVTETRRQTDLLRKNEQRFRLILDSLELGFYTIDNSQRVTAIFGRWAQEQEAQANRMVGRRSHELAPPEWRDEYERATLRALAGEDVVIQWSVKPPDGSRERFYRAHLSPIRESGGQIAGAAGVWTDVTKEIMSERESEALRTRVADADRIESLGKLVSGVAHELNNPLAAILNFTEDLLADWRPDEERLALEVIQAQALRSRTIVRDLLTFVRKGDRRPRSIETPGPVLETLVRALRPGLSTQGVSFTASVDDPDTALLLDRAGFEQVVTNLIANAAHAAGTGGAVRLVSRRDGDCYEVAVEDNGAGISPENLAHVFEPFFTTKPTGQGVGLGLSVSLGIVTAHGGTLAAENRGTGPGDDGAHGARFTMRLPVAQVAGRSPEPTPPSAVPAVPMGPSAEAATAAAMPATSPPARRPSFLLIDDEQPIRLALRRYFERRGWAVDEADDGNSGLAKLRRADAATLYDVILCDLKMPGISGVELFHAVAADSPEVARRFILATGDVSDREISEFSARMKIPVLEKPFELSALEALAVKIREARSGSEKARSGSEKREA